MFGSYKNTTRHVYKTCFEVKKKKMKKKEEEKEEGEEK